MKKLFLAWFAVLALAVLAVPALSENVTGTVVDQNGKPIAKAKVICSQLRKEGKAKADVFTDSKGKFTYKLSESDVDVISFTTTAENRTYGSAYWRKAKPQEVKIILWPARKIKGKVIDENGKPVAGAEICLRYYHAYPEGNDSSMRINFSSESGIPCTFTSGKDGSFTLQHIPIMDGFSYGYMQFTVSAKGRALLDMNKDLKKIEDYQILTDPLACSINGQIHIPDGTSVPDNEDILAFVKQGNIMFFRNAKIAKDGKFTFEKLPPGKTTLMLGQAYDNSSKATPSYRTLLPQPWVFKAEEVELAGGKSTNVDITPVLGATIKVKVVDKNTGNPIPSTQLTINHAGKLKDMYPDNGWTDKNGEFALRVVPGDVSVTANSIEGNSYVYLNSRPTEKFTVADGEDKSDIIIKVDPNQRYSDEYAIYSQPVLEGFELKAGSYELTWDPEFSQGRASYTQVKEDEIITKRIKALPKFVSAKARCTSIKFDGDGDAGLLICALDESKGAGKGWDTLYIDTNRNFDLSDEQPLTFKFDQNNSASTDLVEVKSHQGTGADQTQHPLKVKMGVYKQDKWVWVLPERKGAWKTKIESGKGPVECAIVDTDANGVYGNPAIFKGLNVTGSYLGDYAAIDTNGMGKVAAYDYGSQAVKLCDLTKVGDKFYRIKTNETGNKLTVEPYTGSMGSVEIVGKDIAGCSASPTSISMSGKNGYYSFDNCKYGSVALPAGEYIITYCSLSLDNKTTKTPMSCNLSKAVTVQDGRETSVPVGGKLSLAINPDKRMMYIRRNMQESINWVIKVGDTTVSSIGNSNSADGPRVKFFDKAGKLIFKTTAGYT